MEDKEKLKAPAHLVFFTGIGLLSASIFLNTRTDQEFTIFVIVGVIMTIWGLFRVHQQRKKRLFARKLEEKNLKKMQAGKKEDHKPLQEKSLGQPKNQVRHEYTKNRQDMHSAPGQHPRQPYPNRSQKPAGAPTQSTSADNSHSPQTIQHRPHLGKSHSQSSKDSPFCLNCGNSVRPFDNFCSYCGNYLR